MDNLRQRRIDGEWELLAALVSANREALDATRCPEGEFRLVMRQSPAWVAADAEPRIETEHSLRFVYPRLYPALPLEAYFARPVLHVNVNAATGFVCLWHTYRCDQTIVDAILVVRSIMARKTANLDPDHRMQTGRLALSPALHVLAMPTLIIPECCRVSSFHRRPGRQRLSAELAARASDLAFSDSE